MSLDLFTFTYLYGNGDYYTGQGYAEAGTYAASQVLTGYANETGYDGSYTIDSVVDSGYDSGSGYNNYVYVNSYYDGDTGYGSVPLVLNADHQDSVFGYDGLGSEKGKAFSTGYGNGNASDPYFTNYYEADIPGQFYTFTYYYGNGDSYSGYGYAAIGTYSIGQLPDYYDNETGNQGSYVIDSVDNADNGLIPYWTLGEVYVTSYYDGDTGAGSAYSVSGYGNSGLGSESGSAYVYGSSSYDTFSNYDEADLIDPSSFLASTLAAALVGSGVSISNASYIGSAQAAGTFNDASLDIGISSGIILSTGNIAGIYGPNDSDSTTTIFSTSGDADLNALISSSSTQDAAVLEFDFTPTENFLSFQYVFASEEYNEYVNSSFNDVFGFFLTDSLGNKQNIAIISGTSTPIAINNVNQLSNSAYYRNNDTSDYGIGTTPFNTEFDGLTTVLTAVASVTPGETYHFKLAIADTGDGAFDSAVFITGGTFEATPIVAVNDSVNVNQGQSTTIDVLTNDFVAGGEIPTIVDFQEISDNGGNVTLSDNETLDDSSDDKLIYTPPTGFTGVDQFEYTLADSNGNTNTAEVYIQVAADLSSDFYSFTYTYGNGDSYSGYGYALQGTYAAGQVLDGYSNETDNLGYYTIDSVNTTTTTSNNNYVYVTSYYDSDTDYGSAYSVSGSGSSGLGSESGYAYNVNNSADYFSSYYEADLPGVVQVRLNLLADNDGTPGELIANNQIGVNQSFFVEILVADLRGNAVGVNGLGLDLAWDGLILESINFDPALAINPNFVLLPDGSLDYDGLISNLSGGSLPAFELGQAIGINQLDRFALLHFYAEGSSGGTSYITTTVGSASLADDASYSLDVETYQPLQVLPNYSQYNFTYTYGNGDSYTGYTYATEGTYAAGQVLSGYYNETGNYGSYTIDSIGSSTFDSSYNNRIYVTSYNDADTGFGVAGSVNSGTGYSGFGSEYGYAYDVNGNSSDSYFSQYNEADILGNQKYNYTYHYGNGDSYSGWGYAAVGTYTQGQTIGYYPNETISNYPSGTGAVENNTLGYIYGDSVYHLTYTFANLSDALTLNFIGSGLEGIDNESWGLDNVKVTAGAFNYFNDFESDSVTSWSSSNRSTTPVGSRNFLGEFGNNTVSLALNDTALNGSITVEFDLFILKSWDGIGNLGAGPDKFALTTSNGQTLLNTTFAVYPGQLQSYPDNNVGGYYTIDSVESGNTNTGYNGQIYVTSYNDADTGFGTAGYVSSGTGYSGLGSEYGYAYDGNGNSSDPYFSQYNEADILNQYYTFTYSYGNGDSYSGYGYALAGTYAEGQTVDYGNETGYSGFYTIDSVSAGTADSWYNNQIYVTSYYDGDTGYGYADILNSGTGYSGFGSEYGYAYDVNGNSSDSFFGYGYYEADILGNQLYNYTYHYGNGDSYSGYGYAAVDTYSAGQTIDYGYNETGNYGYYTIDSVELGNTSTGYNGYVYITSYTDDDTSYAYGETTNLSTYTGYYGLGSEYGYAYTAEGASYDSYFSNYWEADLIVPSISITDNSGSTSDSSIKFTTELSKFRKNYSDSEYVRPNYADSSKYFDITNTGTGVLSVSGIEINVAGVTTDLDFTSGDLLINPNESQRVKLTYDAAAAKEVFNRSDALVLFTNSVNLPEFAIALSGQSTFNSDVNYDGKVGAGDLGSLNQGKANLNKGIYDPTADINGDGLFNNLDVAMLQSENKLSLFA